MLRDEYGHADPFRQRREESAQGMDTAGRRTDGQQFQRLVAWLAEQLRCRSGQGDAWSATVGVAQLAKLAEQHLGKASVKPARSGLWQRICRSQGKRGNGLLGAFLGE